MCNACVNFSFIIIIIIIIISCGIYRIQYCLCDFGDVIKRSNTISGLDCENGISGGKFIWRMGTDFHFRNTYVQEEAVEWHSKWRKYKILIEFSKRNGSEPAYWNWKKELTTREIEIWSDNMANTGRVPDILWAKENDYGNLI